MEPALSACDDVFGREMWIIQDPAPELGHINRRKKKVYRWISYFAKNKSYVCK